MQYTIRQLADLAEVSARTLRYYDEIGLLKPCGTSESGYRLYGEKEVDLLQQILFYRERGFDLKQIQKILYQDDFDIMCALQEHLLRLEEQKKHMDMLIQTVEHTIASMKGERKMSDKEKFEVFKEKTIKENEEKYGKEIRDKYGAEEVDASNRKLLSMSEEEWERFKKLEEEILKKLEECVTTGKEPESEDGKQVVLLHRQWLGMTWKKYSKEAHIGLAAMYTADERFTAYYDKNVAGCAEFLEKAIQCWAGQL